jgi:hypothetical protein
MPGRPGKPIAGATLAMLVLGGCGGSSHKTTSTSASEAHPAVSLPSGALAPSATIPPGTPPALRALFGNVMRSGDLPGFAPQGPRTIALGATRWIAELGVPPAQQAKEAAKLKKLGFVAGARQRYAPTNGGSAEAISIVERFPSARAAQAEVTEEVSSEVAHGAKAFAVPAVPGARGFGGNFATNTGVNVAFSSGSDYYLVGSGFRTGGYSPAPTNATLAGAAQRLYARVHH